jgi:hypothetical protein
MFQNRKIICNVLIVAFTCSVFLSIGCFFENNELEKKSKITCDSQYGGYLATHLLDNDTASYWMSGVLGNQNLYFYYDKPCDINQIKFEIEVFPSSITQCQIFYKQKGSGDSVLLFKDSSFITSKKKFKINKSIKDLYSLSFIMKNDSSWIAVKKINFIGLSKNDIYPW